MNNQELISAFKSEIQMLRYIFTFDKWINNFSNLNHPNIVRFIGIYTSNLREQYIVTEFVSRGSLLDLLRNEKEKIKMDNLIEM